MINLKFKAGTKSGQPLTITYQLSSQKCIDDGWTIWPQATAVRYGKRNSQATAVTSLNQTANHVTYQVQSHILLHMRSTNILRLLESYMARNKFYFTLRYTLYKWLLLLDKLGAASFLT